MSGSERWEPADWKKKKAFVLTCQRRLTLEDDKPSLQAYDDRFTCVPILVLASSLLQSAPDPQSVASDRSPATTSNVEK